LLLHFRVSIKLLVEEVEELVARVGVQPIWGYAHYLRVHALAVVLPSCVELDSSHYAA
jgi:hypothetical protein